MKTYNVYALATISKFIGTVEAESKDAAETKAWDELSDEMSMNVCHECSSKIGGSSPDVDSLHLEEAE